MSFTPKPWKDNPDQTTPITAAALIDLETRLAAYTDAVAAGGVELGYAQSTASAFGTNSTSSVDIPGLSVTVTVGSRPILVRGYADAINSTAGFGCSIILNIDGTDTGLIGGGLYNSLSTIQIVYNGFRRLTPSAGSHTYKLRVKNNSSGQFTMTAGSGTGSNNSPAFIQVLQV